VLSCAAGPFVAWLAASATVVLILRTALKTPLGLSVAPGLLALAPLAWLVTRRVRQGLPSRAQVVALLDDMGALGGRLVAWHELADDPARDRLVVEKAPVRPVVRWNGHGRLLPVLAGALYLLGALVIPVEWTAGREQIGGLDLSRELEALGERARVLEETGLLEPERATALLELLDVIGEEARADDPAPAFETLDRLGTGLDRIEAAGIESLAAAASSLQQAEALVEALEQEAAASEDQGAGLDAERRTEALARALALANELGITADRALRQELEAMLRRMSTGSDATTVSASRELPPEMRERLEQLSKKLGACRRGVNGRLASLAEARLIDAGKLGACSRPGSGTGLAAFLAANRSDPVDTLIARWCRRGGTPDRGRADAPMTWAHAADGSGVDFTEQILPPASLAELTAAPTIAVTASAPAADSVAEPALQPVTGRSSGPGGSGTAVRDHILPRHRRAVRQYFEARKPSSDRAPAGPEQGGS
jgi:hypothetical protein